MGKLQTLDTAHVSVTVSRNLRMQAVQTRPGPPLLTDGLVVGFAEMSRDPPHNGELHPDGDELVIVISGRVEVLAVDEPGNSCVVGPGQACIIAKGDWHRVHILEPTRLIHITPGPNGDHRLPATRKA